ncbi:transposase [Thermodesulfovibrionales bacterium]|nr:transposase [Thermodesulfovibrionales bacterium]
MDIKWGQCKVYLIQLTRLLIEKREMARLLRVSPIGIPQHIIQRGTNRQAIFADDSDMRAYLSWLKEYSVKHDVEIHAWVLMTNHVHILCTPKVERATSKMMQSIGRMYVKYFNCTYLRTGTLWEGRFKSCLVQSEHYLLSLYRYIELNPVRAGMVDDPNEYSWSSYGCNALGVETKLQTPHEEYLHLGKNKVERQEAYRELFKVQVGKELLTEIRESTNRGLALGSDSFSAQIEMLTNARVTKKRIGRPKKR